MMLQIRMEPKALELFAIHAPVLDLALRGVVLYLLLFALFRFLLRRRAVTFGLVEMIALVLIADASQNAMAGEAISLAEGSILACSMIATHFFVRLGYVVRHRLMRRRSRMARRLQVPG